MHTPWADAPDPQLRIFSKRENVKVDDCGNKTTQTQLASKDRERRTGCDGGVFSLYRLILRPSGLAVVCEVGGL